MKRETTRLIGFTRRNQKGFTLLEYATGAAVLAGVALFAMNAFGVSIQNFYVNLGEWVTQRQVGAPAQSPQ